ncbi:MAG: acyl carrier protein [Spirochaetia bacterium]|jgi:acyl carrier protein|nr:acyl carrier protein [Spirochaetia bacterium]MBR4436429.1 acyl carrier protein [Spirochaetales bacterium]MBO7093858.1 acyl carrier protein [Spirochaetia bacterium]MBP5739356.1 acyl carrier protein [Spirochaetia bacterium]MBR4375941.1 acyl carrier protein [Spirochaetia bacterium]
MDEVFEKVKKIIAEKLDIEEDKITMEASFRQDLGADSLDTYELIYALEEEMGIQIPDEKANEFETVGNAVEFIKSVAK